jgi:hypothetical protein
VPADKFPFGPHPFLFAGTFLPNGYSTITRILCSVQAAMKMRVKMRGLSGKGNRTRKGLRQYLFARCGGVAGKRYREHQKTPVGFPDVPWTARSGHANGRMRPKITVLIAS